jgi:hypothetical protein
MPAEVYNYFRDYDPSVGRYVEADPSGLKGGISLYGYAGQMPLTAFDSTGLCFIVPLPNGTISGKDDFGTGKWNKWTLNYVNEAGPEGGSEGGVYWSAYTCMCHRTRSVDWRYYLQSKVHMVRICMTCAKPSISEWDELQEKRYYRTQSMDYDQKEVAGGVTLRGKAVMDFDCEGKCDALNSK